MKRTRITLDVFIDRANSIHKSKYCYSISIYTKSSAKIDIICKIHGMFSQEANSHLRGYGCKKCTFDSIGIKKIDVSKIDAPKGCKLIALNEKDYVVVDESDYDILMPYKWYASSNKTHTYAVCTVGYRSIKMHRLIMGVTSHLDYIDHINHHTFDNRKCNLRICTADQNRANRIPQKNNSSKYIGVRPTNSGKWSCQLCINGKKTHIGTFVTEKEAAISYDKFKYAIYGEFAYLNFPIKS